MEDGREIFDDDDDDEYYDDQIFTSKKKKKNKENVSKNSSVKHPEGNSAASGNIRKMFANMPTKKRKIEVRWY